VKQANPADVFGWIRLDPISASQAKALFVPPTTTAPAPPEDQPQKGTSSNLTSKLSVPIDDPFLTRLHTFKSSEYSQLGHLMQQIESRPDRAACIEILGKRLFYLYSSDKRQLKTLREKFAVLAPYLVKS
jgi:hypothetical protein